MTRNAGTHVKRQVGQREVHVLMIGHHALRASPPESVPYSARVHVGRDDITAKLNLNEKTIQAQRLMFRVQDMVCSMTAGHASRIETSDREC